ncbi:MAG: PAS domain-containing protein, partial [Emcibacter sp.]|nr:PAS domain-containing protein [Emcibacter sp.]
LNSLIAQAQNILIKVALIVSDDSLRERCTLLLEDADIEVEALSNPLDSFNLLSRYRPDVFVVDINLHECKGTELVHMVRQDDKWASIPIILMSTEQDPEHQLVKTTLGGDDVVTKPLEVDHLVSAVKARAMRSHWTNRLRKDLQTTLRESKYQIAALNEHDIVSIADVTGRITYVNDKFCEISGYRREELLGKNHRLLKSEVHEQEFYDEMWNNISNGNIWHGTICNRKKNGRIYWVESTIVPFLDDKGKPYKYVSARTDVTDLRISEQKLYEAQSLSNIGNWYINLITGNHMWSDEIYRIIGLEPGSITPNENFLENIVHPDDKSLIEEQEKQARVTGHMEVTHRIIRPNGEVRHIHALAMGEMDTNGKVIALSGTVQDITERVIADSKLRISEERLHRGQSFANIGTWDWNISKNELYWSKNVWQLFGYEKDNISNTFENFMAAIHPNDREMVLDAINTSVQHRTEYNIEHRIIWPDGSSHWVQQSGDVVRDKEGNPLNILGVVQNIDIRKCAELALIERERLLKEAQSLAHIGNWQSNLATGERTWSDEVFRIIGQEPGSCDTTTDIFYKFVHPDDVERVRESTEWAKKTGHKDIVYRIILPDGNVRHLHDLAKADVDAGGNLVMLAGTVQDITERIEAEIKLRETEDRFTFAVEGAGDGIWDWNLETDIMHFSPLYMKMLNYDNNELPHYANSWINSIHPDDLATTKKKLHDYLEGRTEKYSLEIRIRCKGGSYKWILCRGTVVSRNNQGQPLRMIGIHSDITKQKQTEQDLIDTREDAQNANRAKTDFLSSMSHELRTPMNAIMGFGQLLNMETDPPLSISQKENVDEIVKASNHLLELINEVLDLAKIESGRVDLSVEVIILSEVIYESLQLITPLAQRRGIEIILTQNGVNITFEQLLNNQSAVRADRIRLKQILLNLLSNAIKYNNENGELIIDCNIINDKKIRISITDTGHGLTKEQQAKLFKPFSRVGDNQSTIEGVGIGLVITKNLVELMKGTIGLTSQVGVGSTFWIELPSDNLIPLQENTPVANIARQSPNGTALENECSILYIEDNPANLRLVTQLLERQPNIRMWNAHEPLLGLELAAEHKPDLILLDINLPRMNGFEVLMHLRERDATCDTPVIAISANAMPSDIKKGIDAGFDDYITKPININDLLHAVEKTLRGDS